MCRWRREVRRRSPRWSSATGVSRWSSEPPPGSARNYEPNSQRQGYGHDHCADQNSPPSSPSSFFEEIGHFCTERLSEWFDIARRRGI
jgi:hypothetical protein